MERKWSTKYSIQKKAGKKKKRNKDHMGQFEKKQQHGKFKEESHHHNDIK